MINLQGTSSDYADVGNYEFMEVSQLPPPRLPLPKPLLNHLTVPLLVIKSGYTESS